MPGPKQDQIAAAQHVAYVAASFLAAHASRQELADAVAEWSAKTDRLATDSVVSFKDRGIRSGEAVKVQLAEMLITAGVPIATEVRLDAHADGARGKYFRADLAVVRDGVPVLAIEAKPYDHALTGTRQRQNYVRCGIPAIHVGPSTLSKVAAAVVRFWAGDAVPIRQMLIEPDAETVGGKGGYSLNHPTSDLFPESEARPKRQRQRRQPGDRRGRETWLTPFGEAWSSRYESPLETVPWGQLARYLKPLIDSVYATASSTEGEDRRRALASETVLGRWVNYLAGTEARYASAQRFAATFGSWSRAEVSRDPYEARPGESVDAYIERTGRAK